MSQKKRKKENKKTGFFLSKRNLGGGQGVEGVPQGRNVGYVNISID